MSAPELAIAPCRKSANLTFHSGGLFVPAVFQKLNVAISLVGWPIPAKSQVGQERFFNLAFSQSQLTTFGCQCSGTFGLE
jgi:hypothetical protein